MSLAATPFRITDRYQVEEVAGRSRGGRPCVRLLTTLEYHVGHAGSGEEIEVPAGFVTDFASVPFGLWNLFPPHGPWARPAIIHDYIYSLAGELPERRYDRKAADMIFREAMKVVGVDRWRRALMYHAVRLGGGSGWGRKS